VCREVEPAATRQRKYSQADGAQGTPGLIVGNEILPGGRRLDYAQLSPWWASSVRHKLAEDVRPPTLE